MTLKSRLARLQAQAGTPSPTVQSSFGDAQRAAPLHSRLAQIRPARLQTTSPTTAQHRVSETTLARKIGGKLIADGLIQVSETLPLLGHIGDVQLSTLAESPLLPGETTASPSLYIDTETTGLAGGSGTLAFLVGIAHIEGQQFKLNQFLITRFAAEADLLSAVQQSIPDQYRLVSYNGKSYDLPLLTSRFRMHNIPATLNRLEHLDLLHPVRRLFARCWNNCRLTTLENNLLGFVRQHDLPGSEAPEAWFSYLRQGKPQMLIQVMQHNRQDILSLALAHASLAKAVANPIPYKADLAGLARWLANTDEAQAITLLQLYRDNLCDDSLRLLAYLLRRAHDWAEAVPIWETLAKQGCMESIERLAKYHEHVSKDLQAAWQYCKKLPGSSADLYRRDRLREKLAHQQPTTALRLVS